MNPLENQTFITEFQKDLRDNLNQFPEIETVNHLEGLPQNILKKILAPNPLSIFIPSEYEGRGDKPADCLSLLEATSYESLAVGLMMGISGSLFLEPVGKYGQEEAKRHIFTSFLDTVSLGGLMITEPDFGTDALSMQTSFSETDNGFSLKGSKHWAGLTGMADFWLVTARKEKKNKSLSRDINLFIVEKAQAGQRIEVEEYYHKLGLFLIPYGRNKIDACVPDTSRLTPQTSGVKLMMDLLHRSRLRLSGIGLGFIKRMLDEAIMHCRQRTVSGTNLLGYDQVQHRISQLQAWYTIASAICYYSSRVSSVSENLTSFGLQANSAKAVVTDMMQDAAQSLLQLTGAKGYRRDQIAGRAVMDSRPFQIFEGSNDVMYSQIADTVLKEMKKEKEKNLYTFLSQFDLTGKIAAFYKPTLDLHLNLESSQRTRVTLGKVIARLITAEFTFDLAEAGFRKDLIDNAMGIIGNSIRQQVASFTNFRSINVIKEYQDGSNWNLPVL